MICGFVNTSVYRCTIQCPLNSLQTGRSFRTQDLNNGPFDKSSTMFQFPSNGKVFPNSGYVLIGGSAYKGFNSLQTGRSFRTSLSNLIKPALVEFQFPSNGKVFPNGDSAEGYSIAEEFQFPSNGKVFPNVEFIGIHSSSSGEGFNSLQTGRSFRTSYKHAANQQTQHVSIPFKREGLSEPHHH